MNKLFVFSLLICVCCRCSSDLASGTDRNETPDREADIFPCPEDRYAYPTLDTKNVSSSEEADNAYMLPDDVLKSISTAGLIRSLLDLPTLSGYYHTSSNSSPVGTSYRIYARHNSVGELEARKDRAEVLLQYCGAVCPACVKRTSPEEDVKKSMLLPVQLTVLQVLFTREKILDALDGKERREAVALLLQHCEQTGGLPDIFTHNNGAREVMAWIMYDDGYAPVVNLFNGRNPKSEWFTLTTEEADGIVSFANSYINH
ncbi:MAG: hypothetical protein LBJ23_06260 [Tannerella sp.]|nr:hypothetical protein [Tannerella sp.]